MVILSMRIGVVGADLRRGLSADLQPESVSVPGDPATTAQRGYWCSRDEWVHAIVGDESKIDRTEFISFPSSRWHISGKSPHGVRVR